MIAVGLAAERRILERLLTANAVSAASAQPLELRRTFERRRLARLVRRGVVREPSPGRYFVDPPQYVRYRTQIRHRAAAMVLIVVVMTAIMLIMSAVMRGA